MKLLRRVGVVALALATGAGLCIAGAGGAIATTAAPGLASAPRIVHNVDFTGIWSTTSVGGWGVVSENFATGACLGYSTRGAGWVFSGCHVSGASYAFTVSHGTYHSHNYGTIVGNVIHGAFNDGRGPRAYMATRRATTTGTAVIPTPGVAKFGSYITYTVRVTTHFSRAAGYAQVKIGTKLLCTARVVNGVGACRTLATPRGTGELITAYYLGSAVPPYLPSRGSTRVTVLPPPVGNVDFTGTWSTASSGGWVVVSENFATGACLGYSTLGTGWVFSGCQVSGASYVFTVSIGGYHSHNSGTIAGNVISGIFNDGRTSVYTAYRHASTTGTAVTPTPGVAKFGNYITYTVRVTTHFSPASGYAQVKIGTKLLCTARVVNGVGACRTSATPRGTGELITAYYLGSAVPPYLPSQGSTRVTVR